MKLSPEAKSIPMGLREGDETVFQFFGRVTVVKLHAVNTECRGATQQATVIGTSADRAN